MLNLTREKSTMGNMRRVFQSEQLADYVWLALFRIQQCMDTGKQIHAYL